MNRGRTSGVHGRRAGRLLVGLMLLMSAGQVAAASADAADASVAPKRDQPRLILDGLKDQALIRNVGLSIPPIRFGCDASRVTLHRYLDSARQAADQALRALGRFHARIDTTVVADNGCGSPKLTVTPGPVVKVSAVHVDLGDAAAAMAKDDRFNHWRSAHTPAPGTPLNQDDYRQLRDGLLSRVRSAGFLDARWQVHQLRVDPGNNTAQFRLELAAGTRYRFGKVSVRQSVLTPALAERMTGVAPGDPYSTGQLVAINENLMSTGYFSDVRVRPQMDQRDNGRIPVHVDTTRNARTAYEFRVGYGTDTGARIGSKIHRRYVNDRGHKWSVDLSLSQRTQTLSGTYTIPRAKDPLHQHYDLYTALDREDNSGIRTLSSRTGVQWVHNFNRWTTSLFSEALVERSQYGDAPANTTHFWLYGARAEWRDLDNPLFPTRGVVFSTKLSAAARPLLSSTSVLRGHVLLGGLYPLGKWIFKGRVEAGAIAAGRFEDVPKTLRFFAGGDQSVRGYAYESLGPTDSSGQVVGGQYLLVGSAEVMHPLHGKNWYWAAFVDRGNAFDNPRDMALKTGAGLGLRWRSPIGAVRIDVAYPFEGSSHRPRLHLGIGAAF